jgi:hypothetical protein
MSESTQGILILIIVAIITSVLIHIVLRKCVYAIAVSGIMSSIIFQILNYFHIGYIDPFFIIALFVGAFFSCIISAFIGLPFFLNRKQKTKH